jgi:hypothetical protein
LEVPARSVRKVFSKVQSWRKLRREKALGIVERQRRKLVREVFKQALQVCTQTNKFSRRKTWFNFQRSSKKKRTVRILQGGFTIIRGPLDLAEVQGRYDVILSKGLKLRRGRSVDQGHEDRRIYMWNRVSGFHGSKL